MTATGSAGTAVVLVLMVALTLAAVVFWATRIIEVCRLPADQYRGGSAEKITWIVVVVIAGFIGALVWYFSRRGRVIAAESV